MKMLIWGGRDGRRAAYPGVVLGRHAREVEPERGVGERRAEREHEHRNAHGGRRCVRVSPRDASPVCFHPKLLENRIIDESWPPIIF